MTTRRSLTPPAAVAVGASMLTGAGAPSAGIGSNGDIYVRTSNGALYLKTAGAWGSPIAGTVLPALLAALTTFDQGANSTTLTTVPAAVNVGSLTLLTDAITAIGTLQTAVNNNFKLTNAIINILRTGGQAL